MPGDRRFLHCKRSAYLKSMEHDAVLALQEDLRSLADEFLPSADFAAVKVRLHGILSKLPNVP